MDLTSDMRAAMRWAELKVEIDRRLAALGPEEQQRMLMELLAARNVADEGPKNPSNTTPLPSNGSRAPRGKQTKTALLVEFLRSSPNANIAAMTKEMFGNEDEASKVKIRSMLFSLKKQGRVKKGKGPGRWKAV